MKSDYEQARLIKRYDDSHCVHSYDGPRRIMGDMAMWYCPFCGHNIGKLLDNDGLPIGFPSLVTIS